jgi:transposase-like protein
MPHVPANLSIGYKGKPVRIRAILDALEHNHSIESAAMAGGIQARTLYRWMDRDVRIVALVQGARATAEMRCIDGIITQGSPHEYVKIVEVVDGDGQVKQCTTETRTESSWQALAWSVGGDAGAPPVRVDVHSNDVAQFLDAFRSDPASVLAAVRAQRALNANSSDSEPVVDAEFTAEEVIDRIPTDEQGTQE